MVMKWTLRGLILLFASIAVLASIGLLSEGKLDGVAYIIVNCFLVAFVFWGTKEF